MSDPEATRSPVAATRSPVAATRSPVAATRSPVAATRSPVAATRSAAARKAAETRRKNRAAEYSAWRHRHFYVHNEDGLVNAFPVTSYVRATLQSVVDLLKTDFFGTDGEGFDGEDLAVWHDKRILAVVRKGPDGQPQVIVFDDNAAG
jgi:hypothetical protein